MRHQQVQQQSLHPGLHIQPALMSIHMVVSPVVPMIAAGKIPWVATYDH